MSNKVPRPYLRIHKPYNLYSNKKERLYVTMHPLTDPWTGSVSEIGQELYNTRLLRMTEMARSLKKEGLVTQWDGWVGQVCLYVKAEHAKKVESVVSIFIRLLP